MKKIQFTLQDRQLEVAPGTTILEAAQAEGIFIPTLCHSELLKPESHCYLCVVEVEGKHDLLPSCSTVVEPDMTVRTESKRVADARRVCIELLLSEHSGECLAPCTAECPAEIDIPGFITLLAEGENLKALALIKRDMPLPGILGRICHRPCEAVCRRELVEEPVNICHLKRFADDSVAENEKETMPKKASPSGKNVAIVGAGPAGLSAAYFLLKSGHQVTVYESNHHPGGMLRYGIPRFKLPLEVIDREVATIESLGADFHYGVSLGKEIDLDSLRRENEAVFISVGAQKGVYPEGPGVETSGVFTGIDFLRLYSEEVSDSPKIGKRIAVIGGGGVAFDVARTAIRGGGEDVRIYCLEQTEEMPASQKEINEGLEEGITVENGWGFEGLTLKNDHLTGATLIACTSVFDSNGDFAPVYDQKNKKDIDCDTLIFAIGQQVDTLGLSNLNPRPGRPLKSDPETLSTQLAGVFAGGDCVTGAGNAVEAVAAGKKAAFFIDQFLKFGEVKRQREYSDHQHQSSSIITEDKLAEIDKKESIPIQTKPADQRITDFSEIESGYTDSLAREEAKRCLDCGCNEAEVCQLRLYASMFDADQSRFAADSLKDSILDQTDDIYQYESGKCVLCQKCVRLTNELMKSTGLAVANRGAETRIVEPTGKGLAYIDDRDLDTLVELCPVGALTRKKRILADS